MYPCIKVTASNGKDYGVFFDRINSIEDFKYGWFMMVEDVLEDYYKEIGEENLDSDIALNMYESLTNGAKLDILNIEPLREALDSEYTGEVKDYIGLFKCDMVVATNTKMYEEPEYLTFEVYVPHNELCLDTINLIKPRI